VRPVADGIWQLDGYPPHAINAFLVDNVLFDCRTRWAAPRILRELRGREVSMLAITHAHPDHWGSAPVVCAALDIPVACHEADADVVCGRRRTAKDGLLFYAGRLIWEHGTCHEVRHMREGDELGGFRVVHTPGHSRGHAIYFRDADRLSEPPAHTSIDVAENRRSIRKLLELRPSLVLPGHGPPLSDMSVLEAFATSLPASPQPRGLT
jgi:glyoxylase-like metal-dependent hydrolase (beta-lactamase superfamily II)